MIRWLLQNLGLMLLALVIAVVVWIAAAWQRDPIYEDEFDAPIPVQVKNLPSGTHLVDGWQQDVRVRLRAPRSVWDRLRARDINGAVDLSPNLDPLEPGEYDVPVKVTLSAEPAILLAVEPEYIRIELESIREREVPVTVEVRGEPALGYYRSEGPVVVSDTVKIRGPASLVDQVSHAAGNVSVREARDTVENEVALNPVDASGNRVNGVELEPERVAVSVPVTPLPNVKEMSVTLMQLGQPGEGYHVTDVRIDPPVVRVLGPVFILNDLPGFLTTVPISIEGRTEDVVERLALELPAGVSMFDPKEPAVQATIEIEPFFDSVTVTRTLTYQGLQPGLMPVASPEVVEVILSGPRPRLSALLPEDVRVVLDLSGMGLRDEAQVEPVVVAPEGITVESIIPSVIQVQIAREPTPTPQPQE
jgi:YbbR domain-containing protein